MRMQSAAATDEDGSPDHTRSVSLVAASARSRWRTSSGTSLGSRMLRPGVSNTSDICVSFNSCSRSAIVPSRRSPSTRTNGGPLVAQNTMASPPIVRFRAGLRACSVNSTGALATCSRRNSGSNRTTSPSTVCPASWNNSSARGWSNCTPTSRPAAPSLARWWRAHPRSAPRSGASDSGTLLLHKQHELSMIQHIAVVVRSRDAAVAT